MALNLSVIKSPTGVALAATQKSFGEQGGTIGRGDGNDWVLSDPDRFLSSRHCGLSYEGGQYYLTDMSTNGTFINGAPEPLGKGGKIPLNSGDTIEVGDYQFRAEVQADVGVLPDDPFGASSPPLEPQPSLEPQLDDDPFAFSGSQPQSPVTNDPFESDPFATSTSDVSLSPDPLDVDPLAALDKASVPVGGGVVGADDFSNQSFDSNPLPDDDLFAPKPSSSNVDAFNQAGTLGDGAGALNQSLDWPSAQNESVIPENWDDDDLMGDMQSTPTPPPVRQEPPPVRQESPQLRPREESIEEHRSLPLTDPPKRPKAPRPKPAPLEEPLLAERRPEKPEQFKAEPPPVKPKPKPRPKVSKPKNAALAQAVGTGLLEGLGLADREISKDDVDGIHSAIGELMPVIIEGMMQVLRSRASIKNEFRMNVTTIQPIENNPLKFSADAQEAIENMFLRKSSAYMGAKEAFQEGFDGIGEHQVAIIAGIRAAFKSMMDRFNPELLERQFDKQNKGVVLPGMQKTKYWNSYIDTYTGFVDNMENTFQYLFGDEFVQAYEEQLRRLAVERKKKQKFDN